MQDKYEKLLLILPEVKRKNTRNIDRRNNLLIFFLVLFFCLLNTMRKYMFLFIYT